ncbi:hypothetical protein RRG08_066497 [Elysia crispata]|uniref:Uncharacterized protein n=1 Tax=Elysia crispata TaxID=231223 RepID=A0AAE1ADW6_9GAST|nr:hypothetical protein RRG08_066497 [Elysia crispata]
MVHLGDCNMVMASNLDTMLNFRRIKARVLPDEPNVDKSDLGTAITNVVEREGLLITKRIEECLNIDSRRPVDEWLRCETGCFGDREVS